MQLRIVAKSGPVAVLALILFAGSAEAAKDKNKAKRFAERGSVAFRNRNFGQALNEFKRAYAAYPAPGLLFNLGQCHLELRQFDRAIERFNEYLASVPNTPNRRDVELLILSAEQEQSRTRGTAPATTSSEPHQEPGAPAPKAAPEAGKRQGVEDVPPAMPVEPAAPPAAVDDTPAIEASPVAEPAYAQAEEGTTPKSSSRFYSTWWFWTIVGGVAVAAAGTAIAVGSGGETREVLPMGSFGLVDLR